MNGEMYCRAETVPGNIESRRAFLGRTVAAVAGGVVSGCRTTGALAMGCSAGWRTQVEPVIAKWEAANATRVQTTFDGSGRLVSSVNAGMLLDVILTADVSYLDELPVSYSRFPPRLIRNQNARLVTNASRREIVTWEAVLEGEVRLSMASPNAAAIGRIAFATLPLDIRERIQKAVVVERSTVTEVAADVAVLDAADAGIIWDTTWPEDDRLFTVPAPALDQVKGTVGVLVSDTAVSAAHDLAKWIQRELRAAT